MADNNIAERGEDGGTNEKYTVSKYKGNGTR